MNAIENRQLSDATESAIRHGSHDLHAIPKLIAKIIDTQAWESIQLRSGKIIQFRNLRELITTPPLEGWGQDPKKVEALIKDDPEVLVMYREAMKGRGTRTDLSDNVSEVKLDKSGNGRAYTLSRLQKQHPELYQSVCDGQMSANAAAIKAGFRKKLSPLEQVLRLLPKLSDEDRAEVIARMKKPRPKPGL